MIKIGIKNRITGSVIFEYSKKNNTIKETLEKAVRERIDLRSSDLSGSDLSGSDLRSSDLSGSDLSGSDLRSSDLRSSDLSGSDLSGSDLSGSDLSGSDLSGSRNKELAYLPIFCKWSHSIIGNEIKIGCESKTIEGWEVFFNSDEEMETKRGTDEFKQIQAVYESYKAYLIFLNK